MIKQYLLQQNSSHHKRKFKIYTYNFPAYTKEITKPLQCDVHRYIMLITTITRRSIKLMDKEMMKGTIDILLLSLIEQRDLYGYEMTRILKQLSDDTYEMSEGTLYASLKRMERRGWVESYWKDTESGRRKYYRMKDDGKKELISKKENWDWMSSLIQKTSEGLS